MNLKQTIADDLENVFYNTDDFAFEATYEGVLVTLLEDGEQARVEHFPGFHSMTMNVRVRKSEVPVPRVGHQVTINDEHWLVGEGMTGDAGEWFLLLVRDEIT